MIELNDNLKITLVVVLILSYFLYDQKPECLKKMENSNILIK